MEFPKYKEDTTLVDILNFDTWQGVFFFFCINSLFYVFLGENTTFILLFIANIELFFQFYECLLYHNSKPSRIVDRLIFIIIYVQIIFKYFKERPIFLRSKNNLL